MKRKPHVRSDQPNDGDTPVRLHNANLQEGFDDCSPTADRELVAQGWVRRHLVAPDRARESIDLYASLGFEVQVRPLAPDDLPPECTHCASEACRSYVMIYTRRKRADLRRPPSPRD